MDVIHLFTSPRPPPTPSKVSAPPPPHLRFLSSPSPTEKATPHISCLHLEMGGKIEAPSITHAAALLIVHGRVTIEPEHGAIIDFSAGMGAVFEQDEPYTLKSDTGAILLLVESLKLTVHARAISTPKRIEGATWPSDSLWIRAAKKYCAS